MSTVTGATTLLVNAYHNDQGGEDAGKAYLITGRTLVSTRGRMSLADADIAFVGERAGDLAGRCVAGAGDVDGDGLDDILISAINHSDRAERAGKTALFLGRNLTERTGSRSLAEADYTFLGEGERDRSGHLVASMGDIDGDGHADIGIWSQRARGEAGTVYVFRGGALPEAPATLHLGEDEDYRFLGEQPTDRAGFFDPGPHRLDVDGDGREDILLGAMNAGDNDAGSTALFLARNLPPGKAKLRIALDADYYLVGTRAGEKSGRFVASAGDVDGDGRDDLLIGAPGHSRWTGRTALILAASLPPPPATIRLDDADYLFMGEAKEDSSGRSLSPGDVDGDGLGDVLIGAYRNGRGGHGTGTSYLFLGANLPPPPAVLQLGTDQDFLLRGEHPNDRSGRYLTTADIDADGRDDLLISGFQSDESGKDAGKAYVVFSR